MVNWKDIIKSVAPFMGTALSGPMAGAATKFIADKFLGDKEATEDQLKAFILGASPEELIKLKAIESQFKIKMKELEVDIYSLEYKDRNDARGLYSITIWPQVILSTVFVLGYFCVLVILLFNSNSVPKDNSALLGVFTIVLGVLTAAIPQVLNFWFGSSVGSKEKTKGMSYLSRS